ncbi:Not1 N-terminal domain, CCR4-Not complex component-domain-containing protein [Mucor mucedo]|uniref:Not1 N-terminal domain, CCR4-Not complex component-domain-containing protein n=1 Tax=Mucor mucedo TaxID=29922 RepID=UPI00221E6E4E|nr:Not1 N-terminal domain, CCR4-Not complex component-domain-containing protein [Mucor mucedo]KAI7896255.1 Not1 N-terminal domain, CCR4-Not complex component-domain-containing protein [Mucor mucedo]
MSMKKLQAEIDRVLKKVSEGVDTFETIYEKIQSTANPNQKEKYEQDLKKEIKKLQRLRDQIKTWLSSNEIKDKTTLLDNRKLIETEMERFKNVEREMKTKAFSKEGLLQRERMDPKEKEKANACDWISNTVDELSQQIEMAEAELENLQGTTRKGKKDHAKLERAGDLEHFIERDRWHINRLELILRLLENDQLSTDQVVAIQDDVQYYIDCNQEPDFEEDELVYDDLNLEEEEEMYNVGIEEHYTNEEEKSKKSKEKDALDDVSSLSSSTRTNNKTVTSGSPASSKSTISGSPVKTLTSVPPLKSPESSSNTTETTPNATPISVSATLKSYQAPGLNSPTSIKEKVQSTRVAVPSAWAEPIKIVDQAKSTPPLENASMETNKAQRAMSSSAPGAQVNNLSGFAKALPLDTSLSQQQGAEAESRLPTSLADLASSFEAIKNKAVGNEDTHYTNRMLDASLQFVPDLIDSERPKVYQAQTPQLTPAYYPQQPLAIFDNPSLFEKFDMDALFFIFYYQQGTYQQYLAAKELKKQSWRFHKKYLTWFQRHEEPKTITDEYEQGTYIYFDYEGAWCQRKKTEFRFEYRYLEDA